MDSHPKGVTTVTGRAESDTYVLLGEQTGFLKHPCVQAVL